MIERHGIQVPIVFDIDHRFYRQRNAQHNINGIGNTNAYFLLLKSDDQGEKNDKIQGEEQVWNDEP